MSIWYKLQCEIVFHIEVYDVFGGYILSFSSMYVNDNNNLVDQKKKFTLFAAGLKIL